jgi:hypothetical protein
MSALGHKRTFRGATAMSALPSKADIDPRQGKLAATRAGGASSDALLRDRIETSDA